MQNSDTKKTLSKKATIHALKKRVVALVAPVSENEDRRRQEFILNIILSISILFLIALEGTVVANTIRFFPLYHGIPWWFGIVAIICCGSMLWLSKKHQARAVSYTLITLYTLSAIYSGWHWGISLPVTLLSFAFITILSSILVSSTLGFIMSGILIVSLGALSIHEIYSLSVLPWKYETLNTTDVVTYGAILLFIGALSWLSNREIQKSLNRAKISERELALERDLLEIRVKERTEELHRTQAERMAEISRTAEFGRLSQGLFHDLMTPLTSVSLHMEKLKDLENAEIQDTRTYVEKAITASRKMAEFMNHIRSHIRNKGYDENEKSQRTVIGNFSLKSELDAVIELLNYKAREAGVSIRVISENAETGIRCNVDPIWFRRIFLNLISNAIEAHESDTARNSADTNTTETKERYVEIKIATDSDSKNCVITISDNGPGISKKDTASIFEPFFTTKSERGGMGVGLSTVKNIVEKELRGTIRVESILNKRTMFTITFQLKYNK